MQLEFSNLRTDSTSINHTHDNKSINIFISMNIFFIYFINIYKYIF